jgi:hypothetical protein
MSNLPPGVTDADIPQPAEPTILCEAGCDIYEGQSYYEIEGCISCKDCMHNDVQQALEINDEVKIKKFTA